MLQKLIMGILLVFLGYMVSSESFAQDVKKEVKKETKAGVASDSKKDAKQQSKPQTMKYISCSETGCGLWAKSHSARELRSIMKRHTKKYHKTELTDKQLKEMVKKEGAK